MRGTRQIPLEWGGLGVRAPNAGVHCFSPRVGAGQSRSFSECRHCHRRRHAPQPSSCCPPVFHHFVLQSLFGALATTCTPISSGSLASACDQGERERESARITLASGVHRPQPQTPPTQTLLPKLPSSRQSNTASFDRQRSRSNRSLETPSASTRRSLRSILWNPQRPKLPTVLAFSPDHHESRIRSQLSRRPFGIIDL